MAPPLEELLTRTELPATPDDYYNYVTVLGLPTCGAGDEKVKRILVDPTGTTVYYPTPEDVNPKTTFQNPDDAYLRRIETSAGGFVYRTERRPVTMAHLCRSDAPLGVNSPVKSIEVYVADMPILQNSRDDLRGMVALRDPKGDSFRLSDREIIALVKGANLDSGEYSVSQTSPGLVFVLQQLDCLQRVSNFLKSPEGIKEFPDEKRRNAILGVADTIAQPLEGVSWQQKYGWLLGIGGTIAAGLGVAATLYMIPAIRAQVQMMKSMRGGGLKEGQSAVEAYGRDLLKEARDGLLEPVVGRETEVQAIRAELGKGKTANPTLVGPAGSGKSAIAEGFAQRIIAGEYSEFPPEKTRFVELNLGRLTEGASIRGDIESRLKVYLQEVGLADKNGKPIEPADGKRVIIFIDEIHSLTTIGRTDGSPSVGELLKPFTARRGISILGATTGGEYYRMTHHDHHRPDWEDEAIVRRYPKVEIAPMSKEDTLRVLTESRDVYQKTTGQGRVTITNDAIQESVRLADAFEPNQHFPHKGIDVLSRAISEQVLKQTSGPITLDAKAVRDSYMRFKGMTAASMELELKLREEIAKETEGLRFEARITGAAAYLTQRGVPPDQLEAKTQDVLYRWDLLEPAEKSVYLSHDGAAEREGRIPNRFIETNAPFLGLGPVQATNQAQPLVPTPSVSKPSAELPPARRDKAIEVLSDKVPSWYVRDTEKQNRIVESFWSFHANVEAKAGHELPFENTVAIFIEKAPSYQRAIADTPVSVVLGPLSTPSVKITGWDGDKMRKVDDHALYESLKEIDPKLAEFYRENISTKFSRVTTIDDLITRVGGNDVAEAALQDVRSRSESMESVTERALFALIAQAAEAKGVWQDDGLKPRVEIEKKFESEMREREGIEKSEGREERREDKKEEKKDLKAKGPVHK